MNSLAKNLVKAGTQTVNSNNAKRKTKKKGGSWLEGKITQKISIISLSSKRIISEPVFVFP